MNCHFHSNARAIHLTVAVQHAGAAISLLLVFRTNASYARFMVPPDCLATCKAFELHQHFSTSMQRHIRSTNTHPEKIGMERNPSRGGITLEVVAGNLAGGAVALGWSGEDLP